MSKLQRTVLEGDARSRGLTHGETYADSIKHNVAFYDDYFAEHGVSADAARSFATDSMAVIEQQNAEYLAEMRGVAEGSGLPLEEIAMVNVRHTIIYSAYAAELSEDTVTSDEHDASPHNRIAEGCTSFGVQPERTANGHTYIGQNWDWKEPIDLFLMEVRRDDAPDFLALTEAGMVGGKFGFNADGIGFVVNGLSTPDDGTDPKRKPSHVRGRELLDATRLDQALVPIISTPRPTSRNYIVGHASGELVDIETTPDSFDFLYPEQHVITHANHFEKRTGVVSQLERQIPNSIVRGMRVRRLFDRADDDISIEFIKSVLRDDFGKPKSITRHASEDDDVGGTQTNASVIMDLTDRTAYATCGPPDVNDYHMYRLGS